MTQLQKIHKLQRTKSAPSSSRVQFTAPPPLPGPSILRMTYDAYDLPRPPANEAEGSGMGVGVSVSFAPLPKTEIFGRRGKHRLGVIARSEILKRQNRRDRRSSTHADYEHERDYEDEQQQEGPLPPLPQQSFLVETGPTTAQEYELHAKMSKMSLVGESERGSGQSRSASHEAPASSSLSSSHHSQISFKFWRRARKTPELSSAEDRNEPAPHFGNRRPAADHDNHVAPANDVALNLNLVPLTLPILSLPYYENSPHDPAGDQASKDSSTPSTPKRPDFSMPHGSSDHTSPLLSEIALITYSSQGTVVATVTNAQNSISFPERKRQLDNL
jgi:hypothetical protein